VIGSTTRVAALASTQVLARLPQEVVNEALWWERQLQEVIFGLPRPSTVSACPTPYNIGGVERVTPVVEP
jgi:hypothetical protein